MEIISRNFMRSNKPPPQFSQRLRLNTPVIKSSKGWRILIIPPKRDYFFFFFFCLSVQGASSKLLRIIIVQLNASYCPWRQFAMFNCATMLALSNFEKLKSE